MPSLLAKIVPVVIAVPSQRSCGATVRKYPIVIGLRWKIPSRIKLWVEKTDLDRLWCAVVHCKTSNSHVTIDFVLQNQLLRVERMERFSGLTYAAPSGHEVAPGCTGTVGW